MNLGTRLGRWLLSRFGDQPEPAGQQPSIQPSPQAPPAQVYVREVPRKSAVSRRTMLLAGSMFVVAFLIASRTARPPKTPATSPGSELASAAGPDKNRIQRIVDDLSHKNADLESEAAQRRLQEQQRKLSQREVQPGWPPLYEAGAGPASSGQPVESLEQQRREHAYKSLFASPVLVVRAESSAGALPVPNPQPAPNVVPVPVTPVTAASPAQEPPAQREEPVSAAGPQRHDCVDMDHVGKRLYALCEGTLIAARLDNRLVGDFAGPVNAIVDRDVYASDRQHLLIPKGTRLLGRAERADRAFQERLSVSFHRMLLPNGRGIDLHDAIGLDQAGEVALKDKTNRHIPASIATSVALGSLAAFAQFGTGGYYSANGTDLYRQSLAVQAGQTGQQMLARNLNRPPSITIREGHLVEIYLNTDVHLPAYQPSMELSFGAKR
jgi:type IV secretory pathway VirB10-like protein